MEGKTTRWLLRAGGIIALATVLGFCWRAESDCCASPLVHAESAAKVTGVTQRATLLVEGMHCVTCPITVRVALTRLDGVKTANVSMKDGKAVVDYDPTKVTPECMARAVTDAGYPTKVAGGS